MTGVLLADDQALVRAGFRALLDAQPDIDVVGEAADGVEAVELARASGPDVVLMDIRMPRMDGLEATRRITADPALADTRVVVLTTFELDEYVFGRCAPGASGFLLKDIDPPDLLAAVRVVAEGEALLAPRLTRRLIEAFVEQERAAPPVDRGRPARGAHAARARGPRAGRPRPVERRDRRRARALPADREDPRRAAVLKARRARPRAARRPRLRDRARGAGRALRTITRSRVVVVSRYGKRADLIVHEQEPFNAETWARRAGRGPADRHRRVLRAGARRVPEIDPAAWRLRVHGLVERELELSLATLREAFRERR